MATIQQETIARLWMWIRHIAEHEADGLSLGDLESGLDEIDMAFCCRPQDWLTNEMEEELENALAAVEEEEEQ